MNTKKTKIICTVSDNNCSVDFIRSLYENGMDVVRLNSAHASIEGAQKVVDNVREVSDKIAILIDTKGPEIRLTAMESTVGFVLKKGERIDFIDSTSGLCGHNGLYTNCQSFVKDVPVGAHILIDDGSADLIVTEKHNDRLICEAQNTAVIKGRKSINVPGVDIELPSLTDKDRMFINWAIDADIEFVAHSFVRSRKDLAEINAIIESRGSHLKIISKIENQQGIDNLEEILNDCYGVMIARGDLGVEIAAEKIPHIQEKMI